MASISASIYEHSLCLLSALRLLCLSQTLSSGVSVENGAGGGGRYFRIAKNSRMRSPRSSSASILVGVGMVGAAFAGLALKRRGKSSADADGATDSNSAGQR